MSDRLSRFALRNLLLRAIESPDPQRLQQALDWLFGFVRPQRRAILQVVGLSLLASMLVLLQPWLTKLLIDDGLLAKDYAMLVQLALIMIAVGVFSSALAGVNRYLHTRLSARVLFSLRDDVYGHLLKLAPSFFAQRRTGDILSRLDGDVAQIQRFAVDSLFSALSSVLGLVGALVLMVSLSWQLSLIVALLIPLEVLWLRWMRRKVERQSRSLRERSADLSSFLVETLPATKFIQASGQQQREQQRLGQLNEQYLGDLLKLQITEFFTQAVPGTLTSISRAGAFLIGGYWVIEGSWQLGALIAFSTYLGMAVGPVQSLLGLYVAVQRMTVSLERVMELRLAPQAVAEVPEPQPLPEQGGCLQLESVNFSWQNARGVMPLLNNVSVTVPAGYRVALSGPSGSGKTTLIDLLQRHYDPQQGRILLDGIDLRQTSLAQLRQRIAVVSQDIVLFRGTLADNLRYAAPHASDEQLQQVINQAQLDRLVAQLPQGLDTALGERGQQLSGGQRQRIAIARALLQQPQILVMDEATSAVDETTEQAIIQAVDALFADRTRILISHRASSWRDADLHLQLSDGALRTHVQTARDNKGEH
ncbi:MAG: ABC transporter ATP-binding protein/permease [Marinobacterium sp.]|nr:ABC transporter ATP-binding protein/permease [Marinobacterium sp.]